MANAAIVVVVATAAEHGRVLRLPPGFRFHPTDEELVVQYLKRKASSCPLPAAVIPEIHLGNTNDPWDLPGDVEGERYFFSLRDKQDRHKRATRSGYWKARGKERRIVASEKLVGTKKVLQFYCGRHPRGCRTDWIMHEYRLAGALQSCTLESEEWVVCRVFKKKRAIERMQPSCSYSSSSSSSCVTDNLEASSDGEGVSSNIASCPFGRKD